MKTTRNVLAITLGVAVLWSGLPNTSLAQESYEEKAGAITADVLIYRPAGLILTVLGTAAFAVSLPVTACVGGTARAADTLVVTPFDTTFRRPLGADMREYMDEKVNPDSNY